MTSATTKSAFSTTSENGATPNRFAARTTAMLLCCQFVAMWAAFAILAPSINWPASLDEPPGVMLPLILDQSTAVFFGYLSYLLHALILIPVAAILPSALGMDAIQGRTAMLFGGLAGFAKALGIARWLFLMPGLGAAYVATDATEATQSAVAVVYEAFNAYAGGVGEILGVGLFAGVWTLVLSAALMSGGARILGLTGIAAAALLFSTLPSIVGIESPVLLTLSGVLWQLWTLALAIRLWRQA